MTCLECRAKNAAIAQVCVRCGAPVAGQWSGAADPVRAAGDAAGWAAPAAIYAGMAQRPPEPAQDSAVDGAIVAQWVEARRFSTTRLRPGYDVEEVDAFLSAIRDTFLEIRKPSRSGSGVCSRATRGWLAVHFSAAGPARPSARGSDRPRPAGKSVADGTLAGHHGEHGSVGSGARAE